jgi:hypothetical protein
MANGAGKMLHCTLYLKPEFFTLILTPCPSFSVLSFPDTRHLTPETENLLKLTITATAFQKFNILVIIII